MARLRAITGSERIRKQIHRLGVACSQQHGAVVPWHPMDRSTIGSGHSTAAPGRGSSWRGRGAHPRAVPSPPCRGSRRAWSSGSSVPTAPSTTRVLVQGSQLAGFRAGARGQRVRQRIDRRGVPNPRQHGALVDRCKRIRCRRHTWYQNSTWSRYELAPAGSAAVGGSITAVSRIPGSMEVWWIGANGAVQGAFWYEGLNWQRYELTPAGGDAFDHRVDHLSLTRAQQYGALVHRRERLGAGWVLVQRRKLAGLRTGAGGQRFRARIDCGGLQGSAEHGALVRRE